jgi:hypothetical protein
LLEIGFGRAGLVVGTVLLRNRGNHQNIPDNYLIKLGGTALVSASAVPPKFDPELVRRFPAFSAVPK